MLQTGFALSCVVISLSIVIILCSCSSDRQTFGSAVKELVVRLTHLDFMVFLTNNMIISCSVAIWALGQAVQYLMFLPP